MTLPRRPGKQARQHRALRRLRMWVALRLQEQRRRYAARTGRDRSPGPGQAGGGRSESQAEG